MDSKDDFLIGAGDPNDAPPFSVSEHLHQVDHCFRDQAREREMRRQVKQLLRLEERFARRGHRSQSTGQ